MVSVRSINPLDNPVLVGVAQQEVARVAAALARRLRGDDDMRQELVQAGWAQLADDARTWDPKRGSWPVFVRMVVRHAMRRALYVQRAPVSGSPWRAVHWSKGMRSVEVDPEAHTDEASTPESVLVGRRFVDTLLHLLRETAAVVPNGMLGMRVLLGENSGQVAREAGVSVAVVMRAVAAFREAVMDNGALCAFVEDGGGHG